MDRQYLDYFELTGDIKELFKSNHHRLFKCVLKLMYKIVRDFLLHEYYVQGGF